MTARPPGESTPPDEAVARGAPAPLRIGTRGSPLALYQARAVAALLERQAGRTSEIVVIRTSGDRLAEAALSEAGGKRLFVKEIEDALLAGEVDLAVHSSKDMPVALPEGLRIGAVLPREDARDALVLPPGSGGALDAPDAARLRALGDGLRIGTSSVRRRAQLTRLWPAAVFTPIRGNLHTRLRKLDEGEYDALVLAAAGLRRLEQAHRVSAALPIALCVPAPGQGIIAVEVRETDRHLEPVMERIGDRTSAIALVAERAVVVHLGGGCQMPIGVHAHVSGSSLAMTAAVISLDGTRMARAEARGDAGNPERVAADVTAQLTAAGAERILAEAQGAGAAMDGEDRPS